LSSWLYVALLILGLLILGGVVSCFWGYKRFHKGIKSAGFFIGGLLGFLIALIFATRMNNTSQMTLILVIGFLVGGAIGYILSITLNKILTFITGGLIGFFLSILIFSPDSLGVIFSNRFSFSALNLALGTSFPLVIIFSLVFGVLAVLFQRPIIILGTAIWGAAWMVGPSIIAFYVLNKPMTEFELSIVQEAVSAYPVFTIAAWICLAILGSLFQFYQTRKEARKSHSKL
jgi:hypothetical protein